MLGSLIRLVTFELPVMFHRELPRSVSVDVPLLSVVAAPLSIESVAVTVPNPLAWSHSELPTTLVLVSLISALPAVTLIAGPFVLDRRLSDKKAASELPNGRD